MHKIYIQKVLDYIEEHLKDDRDGVLDNSTLAKIAGYSEYHFLRVFAQSVRLTPADYIRKRRISEIVRQIGDNDRPISDLAFEYGFNSKENFTRAFKKEHHILPTDFRSAQCSLRLYEPFTFNQSAPQPVVSLAFFKDFSITAYLSDEDFPPHFWNKYNTEKRSARLSGGKTTEDFGVMIWNRDTNRLDYFIGIRSEETAGDTSGTVRLDISGGLYAVFDTPTVGQHDFVGTIRRTWDWIADVWLPQNCYERTGGFELESYVESSRKYSERIYIPIVKKETKNG